jgi:hypothetical protein
MLTYHEKLIVAKRVKEWENPRCWAWCDKYRLPLTQALIVPQYG